MSNPTLLNELLNYNEKFVENHEYEKYETTKFPNKRMVILTCMDTRLLELLPKALNLGNGDAKIIKDAGALVSHPFGSVMRSILIAVYQLKAQEVLVIAHYDCGMSGLKAEPVIESMMERGISEETIDTLSYSGINIKKWLHGFDNVTESVEHSVDIIKNHPLMPKGVPVHGLVIDPKTGKLDLIVDGNKN
ncbi:carbonic anhydrase [Bacillus sp. ISL-40]|uniref:beta-class carbonic anhydrase n=1 Tax=unclassified Bacillus (in: firmicutes) TaxID=185979 RepID=UPI001BEBA837|nr:MULTISPECIES: carbonic anhydrase [unclassified Bacillus (in: firmicutes)]MBT2700909.1 carbonic anhydrase [Bacillus sp. ISL-40]MBT2724597.1 carbonic anhydrase [Bacillus sp. ISL-46]MBT2743852.1 carbonic anhydrase [Bacillus sp. ISL-77]